MLAQTVGEYSEVFDHGTAQENEDVPSVKFMYPVLTLSLIHI